MDTTTPRTKLTRLERTFRNYKATVRSVRRKKHQQMLDMKAALTAARADLVAYHDRVVAVLMAMFTPQTAADILKRIDAGEET